MTRHHHHRHNHNNDYHIISDYCGCLRTRDATVCLFVFLSVIWYMVTLLSSTSSLSSWLYHFYFLQLSYFTLWLPSMLIIIFLSIFKFRYIFSYFCFFLYVFIHSKIYRSSIHSWNYRSIGGFLSVESLQYLSGHEISQD